MRVNHDDLNAIYRIKLDNERFLFRKVYYYNSKNG